MKPWNALDAADLATYHASSMPSELDQVIGELVQRFALAQENERVAVRTGLNRNQYEALSIFSERAATLAVRENSVDRLRMGLSAVAIGTGTGHADPRDTGGFLLILSDAGRRIGADVTAELLTASRLAGAGSGHFKYYAGKGAVSRTLGGLVLRLGIGMERVEGKRNEFRYHMGPKLTPDAVRAREAVRQLQADAKRVGQRPPDDRP